MLGSSDPGRLRGQRVSAAGEEVTISMKRSPLVINQGAARFPMSRRVVAFAAGDLMFMIGVTATAAAAANIAHQPEWGMAVGVVVGMSLAMLAQTTLAFAVAPVLGSIDSMVPSMVAAMAGSTAVCVLHVVGWEPTSTVALKVGAGFGVVVFGFVKAYGWSYRRSLGQRRG